MGERRANGPAPAQEVDAPMQRESSQKKLHRHRPTQWHHIYRSERRNGSTVYEAPPPKGNRLYEVVGPRLDEAKRRAHELYGDLEAQKAVSVGTTARQLI